jgi:hypothetical protein
MVIHRRFYVLNMPISTTAPIDAKTHVWPIDGIAQLIDQSAIAIGPYPGKNMRRFLIGCRLLRQSSVNNYKCVIDTHIILVRVVLWISAWSSCFDAWNCSCENVLVILGCEVVDSIRRLICQILQNIPPLKLLSIICCFPRTLNYKLYVTTEQHKPSMTLDSKLFWRVMLKHVTCTSGDSLFYQHVTVATYSKCLLMQRSTWTLSMSVSPLVRGKREFDIELTTNPEDANIFSLSIFWRTHSNYAP